MNITLDTIGALVAECRRRGIVFTVGGTGFKCTAPPGVMAAELQAVLKTFSNDIRDWLLTEVEPTFEEWTSGFDESRAKKRKAEWPRDVAAAADFVLLLTADDLQVAPIQVRPGCTIVDREKWLKSLKADVPLGVSGPRSVAGAVQDDITRLREVLLNNQLT
jgi:hypothetical protein